MIHLGLLGKNIGHSLSERIYSEKLPELSYHLFDIEQEELIPDLPNIFSTVQGLSITSPYKRFFFDSVKLKPEIEKLQAINCIKKQGGDFFGTNTDYLACEKILEELLDGHGFQLIILLGSGAMAYLLTQLMIQQGIEFVQYFRKKDGPLEFLDLSKGRKDDQSALIINSCAREFHFQGKMSSTDLFWDLNYSHLFHQDRFKNSSHYLDGFGLLKLQAEFALEFWGI